jgi:hypothetical protein
MELLFYNNIKSIWHKEIHDIYDIYTASISSKYVIVIINIFRSSTVSYLQTYNNFFSVFSATKHFIYNPSMNDAWQPYYCVQQGHNVIVVSIKLSNNLNFDVRVVLGFCTIGFVGQHQRRHQHTKLHGTKT